MLYINRAIAIAIVFFSVIVAGVIGYRIDQTTIALLGGVFIALVVSIPATAIVVLLFLRERNNRSLNVPTQQYRYHIPQSYYPPMQQQQVSAPTQYDIQQYPPLAAPQQQRNFYLLNSDGTSTQIYDDGEGLNV